MNNFEVSERVTEDGGILEIKTRHGLMFEDGSTVKEIVAGKNMEPRIGEMVRCGSILVKVSHKRYDSNGRLWLMDEDTRAWFRWQQ